MQNRSNLENEIEAAHLANLANFGPARDMFHPDYGWILVDNVVTPEGILFWHDVEDRYNKTKGE